MLKTGNRMAKKYTRKHLGSMKQLDLEQEKLRNKGKSIEYDFVEMLNPQQLAITFLGNFLNRKLRGGKAGKKGRMAPVAQMAASGVMNGGVKGVVKHPLFKTLLKRVGMSFLKWQAFNLALFAGKKIYKTVREQKEKKRQKLLPVVVSRNR